MSMNGNLYIENNFKFDNDYLESLANNPELSNDPDISKIFDKSKHKEYQYYDLKHTIIIDPFQKLFIDYKRSNTINYQKIDLNKRINQDNYSKLRYTKTWNNKNSLSIGL